MEKFLLLYGENGDLTDYEIMANNIDEAVEIAIKDGYDASKNKCSRYYLQSAIDRIKEVNAIEPGDEDYDDEIEL